MQLPAWFPPALLEYGLRVWPAIAALALFLLLVPRRLADWRIFAYVFAFAALRDAMTPLGLWNLGPTGALRFSLDGPLLVGLGLLSLALAGVIHLVEPGFKGLLVPFKGPRALGVAMGVLGAFAVAGPVLGARMQAGLTGPLPPASTIGAIAAIALLGNFLEEALFRGWFQGLAEKALGPWRAAWASAALFALAHVPLAVVVTGHGWPILAFVFYEGAIAAALRMRFGLAAAVLAHGGGILLIAAGP